MALPEHIRAKAKELYDKHYGNEQQEVEMTLPKKRKRRKKAKE